MIRDKYIKVLYNTLNVSQATVCDNALSAPPHTHCVAFFGVMRGGHFFLNEAFAKSIWQGILALV